MLQNFTLLLTIFAQVEPQNQTPIWLPILIIVILLLFLWWGLTRNSIPEGETTHTMESHDGHESHDAHGATVADAHHDDTADHAVEAAALHAEPARAAAQEDGPVSADAKTAADSVPMARTAAIEVEAPPPPGETIPTHTEPIPDSEDASIELDAPPPEDAGVHPTGPDRVASTAPTLTDESAEPDDLKLIEGIGPKINGVLNEAGITTFEQVANTSVEDLTRIVKVEGGVRIAFPESWPEQAALAAKGEWEALERLQDQLQGGRRT